MTDVPTPRRVVPIVAEFGVVSGHRFVILSLEDWDGWFDLRFARIDTAGDKTLPRRIPPPHAWRVTAQDGTELVVEDAVGRGDRHLSIGEVRVAPGLPDGPIRLRVEAEVLGGIPPLRTELDVPGR